MRWKVREFHVRAICEEVTMANQYIPTSPEMADQLFNAAWTGRTEELKALLNAGWNPNVPSQGELSLNRAVRERHADCVAALLDYGADPNASSEKSGHTALHIAAWRGDVVVAKMLLARKPDLDIQNVYGNTPLHEAAAEGHIPVMALLLAAGCEKTMKNKWELTPAEFAGRKDQPEAAAYLVQPEPSTATSAVPKPR